MPHTTPARRSRAVRARLLALAAAVLVSVAVLACSAWLALSKLAAGYVGLMTLITLAAVGDASLTGR
ncbi:hypothetical protein ABT352_22640 [Streptosporangium sp. NPDC000563]|uniref:hypothetical protein n=1 Tax=Streptosporangium sp. NPDC000563 TaxID=3154366 RepID=UPI0033197E03